MLPLQQEAGRIYSQLQSDGLFEHVGHESRHVLLPTEHFIEELTQLRTDTIDPFAQGVLGYAINMFHAIGEDGVLVRIKGGTDIEIRGASTIPDHVRTPEDKPTAEELIKMVFQFDNSIHIDLTGMGPFLEVSVFSADETLEEKVNEVVKQIPEQAKIALVKGLLNIVSGELDQILEN